MAMNGSNAATGCTDAASAAADAPAGAGAACFSADFTITLADALSASREAGRASLCLITILAAAATVTVEPAVDTAKDARRLFRTAADGW